MIKWILWTFVKGFKIIGISIIVLGFMACLISVAGILVLWGLDRGDYLILISVITGYIFIDGLIVRALWSIKLPSSLRKL